MDEENCSDDLRSKIENFLRRNFPQIQMHGGEATITNINEEEGSVDIHLGGACSGCGVSPMTTQALKKRLPKEIEEIDEVNPSTGDGSHSGLGGQTPFVSNNDDDDGPKSPF